MAFYREGHAEGGFETGIQHALARILVAPKFVFRTEAEPGAAARTYTISDLALASRLSGSADIYQWTRRAAYASVNLVTAHDGYTLHDLVSYEQKHNEANGENNQDGANDNISRNWGAEGPTDDPAILDSRYRAMRNFLATLAFPQGVPMIAHGDEMARTQRGNNNA